MDNIKTDNMEVTSLNELSKKLDHLLAKFQNLKDELNTIIDGTLNHLNNNTYGHQNEEHGSDGPR